MILGAGAHGKVYKGQLADREVAIKVVESDSRMLRHEALILKRLSEHEEFPQYYAVSVWGNHDCIIMELLGPNLHSLWKECGSKFSLKTTMMVGVQVLDRLRTLHECGLVHRDIKPQNFVLGLGPQSHTIKMIDYGLSNRYLNRDGRHMYCRRGLQPLGTLRYMSANCHMGKEPSRRDDLESMSYMLVEFYQSTLPWHESRDFFGFKIKPPQQWVEPEDLAILVQYTRTLAFEKKPDYLLMKNIMQNLMGGEGEFDWNLTPVAQSNSSSATSSSD